MVAKLRTIASSHDVVRVSLDALVRSSDTKFLSANVLLGTEGLLAQRPDGTYVRAVPYTGKDIGVALIDSGLTPNGELNDVTLYDFTQGGIETVVSAMRHGAFDFVVKPASPDRLQTSISNALKVEAVEDQMKRTSRRRGGHLTFKDLIRRGDYEALFEANRRRYEAKWKTHWVPHERAPLRFEPLTVPVTDAEAVRPRR